MRGSFRDSMRPGSLATLRAPRPVVALAEQTRRSLRRLSARVYGPGAGVVFHSGYAPPDSAIVDHRRAAKILDHLFAEGWLLPSQVSVPPALSLSALRRVHDDAYLESLDTPRAVARALGGSEPPPVEVAAGYLAAQRWATAGTVLATRLALARSGLVINLGGGFHHAERARGSGFCLFNDIAVALGEARAQGFTGRVLVIDLDLHQGDGTRRILSGDPRVTAISVHATAWDEEPLPNAIDVALGPGVADETYLSAVRAVLARAGEGGEPDLVLYVAGVDVAIDDTLGSWRVSADAVAERDRLVLSTFARRPLVMMLAGGYGPDAWRHSARTVVWAMSGRDAPIPSGRDVELRQFRRVARTFGEEQLSGSSAGGDDFGITEADVMGDLIQKGPGDHLLGFYTAYGMELVFERYGLFEHLKKRGYPRVRVELNLRSGSGEAITVRTDDARRLVLVELIVREMREVVPYRLLSIEWLLLQDPLARPTPERPLLPGQDHPGLGAVRIMMGMLSMAAERLQFDGLTYMPAHYHTAAQARGTLRFLDPRHEAVFVAIKEAIGARSLFEATHLIAAGKLVHAATGETYSWKPARMVIPLSPALKDAVEAPEYDRQVEEAARDVKLRLAGHQEEDDTQVE